MRRLPAPRLELNARGHHGLLLGSGGGGPSDPADMIQSVSNGWPGTTTSSPSVALGSYDAGDLLLVILWADAATYTSHTSGWTRAAPGASVNVFWKVASGSESLTVNHSGGSGYAEWFVYRIKHHDVSGGIGIASISGLNPGSVSMPGGSKAGIVIVAAFHQTESSLISAAPSGYSGFSTGVFGKEATASKVFASPISSEDPPDWTRSGSGTSFNEVVSIAVPVS